MQCLPRKTRANQAVPVARGVLEFTSTGPGAVTITRQVDGTRFDFDVPGFGLDELEIDLSDGQLLVSGKRQETKSGGKELYSERRSDRFRRRMRLDKTLDPSSTDAVLQDGVLTLSIRRKPEAQPLRIAVRDGSAAH